VGLVPFRTLTRRQGGTNKACESAMYLLGEVQPPEPGFPFCPVVA
jgi:hypothetical protein